jgi:hypothetical protein
MSPKSSAGSIALREQVHGQGHDVDVAGALPVAEQRALDPIGAGQHRQLGRRHGGAAVVVGVQAQHDGLAVLDGAAEPLDDVGVHVGAVHLDGGGQVEDHRTIGCRLDDVHDRLADLDGELGLGAGEALRRVLVADGRPGNRLLELLAESGRVHRDVDDAGLVEAEHDPTLQLRHRVVEVHHGTGPDQRLEGALNQLLPALHQDLDLDIVGDHPLVDDETLEVEVGLGAEGKPTSISLKPTSTRVWNKRQLAFGSPSGR